MFQSLRSRLKIRVRLMLLTSGIVFFSVLILSTVVIVQYQRLLVEKTLDVCRHVSINLNKDATDELLFSEDVYTRTREAMQSVQKSGIEGFRASYIVNQNKKSPAYGTIVAHTAQESIGKRVSTTDLSYYETIRNLDFQSRGDVLRFAFALHVEVSASSIPIRLGTAVFEFDRDTIYKPVNEVRNSILIVSLLLLTFSLAVAYLLSARLSRPIENLAHAAEQIAQGKLGVTVNISTAGEIGQLGNTFNHMSRSLKESEAIRTEQAAMKRELEIARGIQMAVLPPNAEAGPYSFRGYMQTADEVGGDYYDLIEIKNGRKSYYWFFIGDVSGHGLRAGLTMLMAQTAIHAAMEVAPGLSPEEAYSHVNEVLFENIRRLKERKYMTAAFYRADDSGDFMSSGLHQDALIYRAAKKKVELSETEGFWLGVDHSTKKDLGRTRIHLAKNDILFLFTDGLVEAMNAKKQMFGQEKVASIIQDHGSGPIEVLEKAILTELKGHLGKMSPADDVTFAIIRRNR